MHANPRAFLCTLAAVAAVALLSCHEQPGASTRPGTPPALATAEHLALATSLQRMQHLAAPGHPTVLDLGDAQQYEFLMARLRHAGQTPSNAPRLFEKVAALRRAHVARAARAPTLATAAMPLTAGPQAMHFIEMADVRPGGSGPDGGAAWALATAGSTFPGGATYTYLDIAIWAADGTAVGPMALSEEFANVDAAAGRNVLVSTSGTPSLATASSFTFDSFLLQEVGDTFLNSYVHLEAGTVDRAWAPSFPSLGPARIESPVDVAGPRGAEPDGLIRACLRPVDATGCDYVMYACSTPDERLRFPLKGSIAAEAGYRFDRPAIEALQAALTAGQVPALDPGQVKLILTDSGGGCDLQSGNPAVPPLWLLWNQISLSDDDLVLSWDATGPNAPAFDEGCTQEQAHVKLTMRLPAPLRSEALAPDGGAATHALLFFTVTNEARATRPDGLYLPVALTP